MHREYGFVPESEQKEQAKESSAEKGEIKISIVGSSENDKEQNQKEFGKFVAQQLADSLREAQQQGKKLVFDMATGSTPKDVWPEIKKMVEAGELDLSNIIIIGHEEAWGDFEPGSKSDFDAYRKRLLEDNNLKIEPITNEKTAGQRDSSGNFVPMHLSDDPESAAAEYSKIIHALQERDDTTFFGLYGVGTDGHIAEIQPHFQSLADSLKKRQVHVEDIRKYSVEKGAFRWQKDDQNFHPEDNVFWQRGKKDIGRAVWQGYKGIDKIVSLGWKEMLQNDSLVLAFNDESKKLAFELAMQGSIDGNIIDEEGQTLMQIKREKGEGEKILPELIEYAEQLEEEGILQPGTVQEAQSPAQNKRCDYLFKKIYQALDAAEATFDDDRYKKMWTFANRYIGKRAPVSRLIRLRTLLGKKTQIIATPEVIKGTKYQELEQ